MQDFKNLKVWSKSHQLTLNIYKVTKLFPDEEKFGLVSQIRRSSASIPTNIAEGSGRGSKKDFNRFLQIAMGSASETEYQLLLAKDLNYLEENKFNNLTEELIEIKKMIFGLMNKLTSN